MKEGNNTTGPVIRIMVVDDQRLVRRCICAKLNSVPEFKVVAEAESGERARQIARETAFDLVLMDLNMPGIGGLEATRRLLAAQPGCKIIGLSMYIEGPYPRKFLELGGAGYVSKNADTEELIRAIREVWRGECYISADVAQEIAIARAQVGGAGDDLTQREIQVLQKICAGLGIEAIASVLCLSPKTVAYHRRRLLEKLGAENDVRLAIVARNSGLAELGAVAEVADGAA